MFGVPASRNQMKGSAAVGCAINAGMAVGAFDSYAQAVEKMVRKADEFTPNPENTAFYQQLNEKVYKQTQSHFDPVLKTLSELVD